MKFTVDAKSLSKSLSSIKSVVGKGDLPILKCVMITAKDECVELKAFNGVFGITTKLAATIESGQGDRVVVDHSLLLEVASKLDEAINISLTDTTMLIKQGKTKFNLVVGDPDEYPNLPVLDAVGVEFDWGYNSDLLAKAASIASTEMSKQILTGVSLKTVENATRLAATDSHRLVTMDMDCDLGVDVVIPRELILSAVAAFKNESSVILSVSGNTIKLESLDTQLIGFTIAGDYPRYEQLIPAKFVQEVTMSAKDLSGKVNLVMPIAKEKSLVKFEFKDDALTLNCNSDLGLATAGIENLEIKENLDIAFNIQYLLAGLNAIDSEFVFKLNSWNTPAIIAGENYTYLIMPVQVRD